MGEEYKSFSSSLRSLLHSPVTSSLLGPNILLNTMFSNTLSFLSSRNVSDQISHPYKTTGKIIVLYILIFNFWMTTWKTKDSAPNYSKHFISTQMFNDSDASVLYLCLPERYERINALRFDLIRWRTMGVGEGVENLKVCVWIWVFLFENAFPLVSCCFYVKDTLPDT